DRTARRTRDAGPEAVVDRESVELVLYEPSVPIATDRRPNDVGRVAPGPGAQDQAIRLSDKLQIHNEGAALHPGESVLERIPAGHAGRDAHDWGMSSVGRV